MTTDDASSQGDWRRFTGVSIVSDADDLTAGQAPARSAAQQLQDQLLGRAVPCDQRGRLADGEGGRLFIGDAGPLDGPITARVAVEVEPGRDDRIERVELLSGQTVAAEWTAADTDAGRRLEADCELPPAREGFVMLRIRHVGEEVRCPSNVAAARGPWAWTSPIWPTAR